MAFDFPASPTVGTVYTPSGGPSYIYDGVAWTIVDENTPLAGVFKVGSGVVSTPQATLDIPFPAGYTAFQLSVAIVPATAGGTLSLRYSTDGTTFDSSANYQYGANVSVMSASPLNTAQGNITSPSILLAGLVGYSTNVPASFFLDFPVNPVGVQFVTYRGAYWNGTAYYNTNGSGYHGTLLTPLKAIRLYSGAGNIASATWQLNGIK